MGWLNRTGAGSSVEAEDPAATPQPVERPSLGIATLFDGVRPGEERALLDMGRATASGFNVYRKYARHIRFADLLREERRREFRASFDTAVPVQTEAPYDLLLLWDLFDRVGPGRRGEIMDRLVERSAPRARLHLLVNASEDDLVPTWDFSVTGLDCVRYTPAGPDRQVTDRMLPAEVERALEPFEVVRAFVSRSGMREYVAVLR